MINVPIGKLIGIGLVILTTLGGVWQYRSMTEEISDLKDQTQTLKQQRALLSDSLEVVGEYVADSVRREVLEKAQEPVSPDTVRVPVPVEEQAEGEVSDRTTAELSIEEDSTSGISQGVRQAARKWIHEIQQDVGIYNLYMNLRVQEPGDSLAYTTRISTDAFKIQIYRYEDEGGIRQVAADVPIAVDVSRLNSTYAPQRSNPEQDLYVHLPDFITTPNLGLRGGIGLSYESALLWGTKFQAKGGIYAPVWSAQNTSVAGPVIMPFAQTSIKF